MQSTAATVPAYLKELPDERRAAVKKLRKTIKDNLPPGFKELMGYGMPSYVVPHRLYPAGYHCNPKLPLPFLSFASQKRFVGLYHMGIYADPKLLAWFQAQWPKHVDTKLDMGKSCVRFQKPDEIPFALVGELCQRMTPAAWIQRYEAGLGIT